MILVIDNYDSFVHNLARYFERLGQRTIVVRHDAITVEEARRMAPDAIVLSPGPKGPHEAGCSLELVKSLHAEIPILGVCLGHQVIATAFGGRVVRSEAPVHGRASAILHDSRDIFASVPSPFLAGRYHSLIVEESSLPSCLVASARTPDGFVMGLRHRDFPVFGLQFHPESILTEHGLAILANFCGLIGLKASSPPSMEPCFADIGARPLSPTATPIPY
jgi:anthranilate synthase/aminodeoxychorismate synthase-like glutamine amidotransferase